MRRTLCIKKPAMKYSQIWVIAITSMISLVCIYRNSIHIKLCLFFNVYKQKEYAKYIQINKLLLYIHIFMYISTKYCSFEQV